MEGGLCKAIVAKLRILICNPTINGFVSTFYRIRFKSFLLVIINNQKILEWFIEIYKGYILQR
jgi:hypothetical protein